MKRNRELSRWIGLLVGAALLSSAAVSVACPDGNSCQRLYKKGVMHLDINPAFLNVDQYNDGEEKVDGLTISSFFNAYIDVTVQPPMPPLGFFERDLVARITDVESVDYDNFDPTTDVERLTDLNFDDPYAPKYGPPKTVWPNEVVRAPDGFLPFEAVVMPQGFMSAGFPGRLSIINLDDPNKTEYLVHQSTQGANGPTGPMDPTNAPRFYHRVLFMDMNMDGRQDLVTVRSGMRFGPYVYPPYSELVYFVNPGDDLDPTAPWTEVVLFGGPTAGFLGPDMSLSAHDFEGDGVPEFVATHFFSVQPPPGMPMPLAGKITIYGAPVGMPWAAVNQYVPLRTKDIALDQGYPFDVIIKDLNNDGKVDLLATNHQPDNCSPMTSSPYAGRVFAYEQPASGDVFGDEWTLRVLLDDIVPNPSMPGANPPGRMAPGHAKPFYPIRVLEYITKPWILVTGDEASKVWILEPENPFDPENWNYVSSVVFDINDYYGPGTTQTPMMDPFGMTNSTIGAAAVRYDSENLFGMAEIYVPAFEAKDIHVFTYRPDWNGSTIVCPEDTVAECQEAPAGPPMGPPM